MAERANSSHTRSIGGQKQPTGCMQHEKLNHEIGSNKDTKHFTVYRYIAYMIETYGHFFSFSLLFWQFDELSKPNYFPKCHIMSCNGIYVGFSFMGKSIYWDYW